MQDAHRGYYVTQRNEYVKEILLPVRASQSGLAGEPINCCTVISTLVCMYAYRGCLSREEILNENSELVERYCNIMKIGNLR